MSLRHLLPQLDFSLRLRVSIRSYASLLVSLWPVLPSCNTAFDFGRPYGPRGVAARERLAEPTALVALLFVSLRFIQSAST